MLSQLAEKVVHPLNQTHIASHGGPASTPMSPHPQQTEWQTAILRMTDSNFTLVLGKINSSPPLPFHPNCARASRAAEGGVSRDWASSPRCFPGTGRLGSVWLSPPWPDWREWWTDRQELSAGTRVLFQKQLPWGTYQGMGTNFSSFPQNRLNRKGQWGPKEWVHKALESGIAKYLSPFRTHTRVAWAQTSTTLPSGRRGQALSPQVLVTISNQMGWGKNQCPRQNKIYSGK